MERRLLFTVGFSGAFASPVCIVTPHKEKISYYLEWIQPLAASLSCVTTAEVVCEFPFGGRCGGIEPKPGYQDASGHSSSSLSHYASR